MRLVTLFLLAAFAASTVDAASYQKTDGTIVDPIMDHYRREPHPYSGANLEPEADLTDAILNGADLSGADLSGVSSGGVVGSPSVLPDNWQLTQGYLIGPEANLLGANLTDAILTNAILTNANLADANLTGANLSGVRSGGIIGTPSVLPTNWQLI